MNSACKSLFVVVCGFHRQSDSAGLQDTEGDDDGMFPFEPNEN